jgi:multiple sugar transport system permease protein
MMPVSRFRPVTPVGQVLWDEHARAMDLAIRHALTPQEALRAGQRKVQEALDLVVKRKQYPLLNWSYPLAWAGGAAAVLLLVFAARLARDNRRRGRQGTKENWAGLTFAGPWLLGFVILTAGPVLASLVLSFCRYDVLHPIEYAGWDNYLNLIRVKVATAGSPWPWQWHWKAADPLFWKSLWNTIYMVAGVPLGMAVGLGVAMLLNANVRGLSTYRTIYYLPAIVPAVAASILWLWVLSPEYGLINSTLKSLFGLAGPQVVQALHHPHGSVERRRRHDHLARRPQRHPPATLRSGGD